MWLEHHVPPAVSHFAAGGIDEQRKLSAVVAVSQLASRSRNLVLIIVRTSICQRLICLWMSRKSPGMPLAPAKQRGPVSALLALRSAHTRTNLI
ncbi:hypothetical protein PBY51_006041 [Eleginops maclovinus]|uniref:Uncharacterized protein n=1 Tax=Eleginops maclovinus TaxID=56733 RepID=A0AAN7ZVB8_ELEMC|nr:hypothetical protein PBY51_006041 [Eleginops maclovinus]